MKSILAILAFCTLSLAAPSLHARQETAAQATDRLLFSTSISAFESARNAKNPSNLDWSSDGCSSSPDNPFGFNFIQSCHRHDFGYRNYKAQSRFTDSNKARIDTRFRTDMHNQCETEGNAFEVAACKGVADVYYAAVSEFGTKRAVEFEGLLRRDGRAEVGNVETMD